MNVRSRFTGDKSVDSLPRKGLNELITDLFDLVTKAPGDMFIVAMGPFALQSVLHLIKDRGEMHLM